MMPPKDVSIGEPAGGWKDKTYYLVEVSHFPENPIYRAVYFSGFLHNGYPGTYSGVVSTTGDLPGELHYLKIVSELCTIDRPYVVHHAAGAVVG